MTVANESVCPPLPLLSKRGYRTIQGHLIPPSVIHVLNPRLGAIDALAVGSNLGGAGSALPLSGLATMLSPVAWTAVALGLSTFILKRVRP